MIDQKQIDEWRKERGCGMTSAVGEYTPAEFWLVLDELETLRKDAERYRWLRDEDGAFEAFTAAYYNAKSLADIDAALDAAIATSGGAVGAA